MKKLGKRSSLESGTFFAYACNCNCGSVPCGTCNNCNDYKNPQSTGAYALSYVTQCVSMAEQDGELSATRRLSNCLSVRKNIENEIKNYIVLRNHQARLREEF